MSLPLGGQILSLALRVLTSTPVMAEAPPFAEVGFEPMTRSFPPRDHAGGDSSVVAPLGLGLDPCAFAGHAVLRGCFPHASFRVLACIILGDWDSSLSWPEVILPVRDSEVPENPEEHVSECPGRHLCLACCSAHTSFKGIFIIAPVSGLKPPWARPPLCHPCHLTALCI